ncbi:PE family protein [Mycobacterium kubicae]|uniref:PE family protein n=1 Tax=Mycobacterium kubicae TaxID=120959 RepID=UPI0007FBD2CE|nr:PE family protein [Mycobacterium kubicae]OBF17458.1 PE family protein [Mycobacterium kubicae]
MDSMSHDPVAGDIGSQLVDIGSQGINAGTTAAMSVLSGLIPAGGEEVSAQAVMAFAQEAASMLASNTAAQEELMRTGTALTDIARMYGDADTDAAGALTFSGAAISRSAAGGGSSATAGAGLLRAGALPGEAGVAARTPLMSQLIEAPSSPMASAAANAGSSTMGGAAPLGSGMGSGAPAGGASKAGLASAAGPADEDDRQRDDVGEPEPGERLA